MTTQLRPTHRYPHSENDDPFASTVLTESERVDTMIENMNKPVPLHRPTIYPFFDVDTYIFMTGMKGEEAAALRERNPPLAPITNTGKREVFNKYKVPNDPDWVKVEIRVTPKGRVKVAISVPLEPLKPYLSKGKVAPIETRILAAKNFGSAVFLFFLPSSTD